MGQGSRTVLAQVVAEVLGVDPDEVDVAPPGHVGRPRQRADRRVADDDGRGRAARDRGRPPPGRRGGRARAPRSPASREAFARLHGPLRATEQFHGFPGIEWDDATYRGDAYAAYSWACAVAAVDVDLDTGVVRVRSVVQAADAGRIVNAVLAEGQVEGGTLQAVGYATIEEMRVEAGRYRNDRLSTYLIPTALDAPRIETILVERPFSGVPARREGPGRAADGRPGAGRHRGDPRRDGGLDPGPARDAGEGARRAAGARGRAQCPAAGR